MKHAELKSLNTQLSKAEYELKQLQAEQANTLKQITSCSRRIQGIKDKIDELTSSDTVISEHAIVRYIERVWGTPIDTLLKEILPDDVRELVATLGDGKYPAGQHVVVVSGNTVVTVEPVSGFPMAKSSRPPKELPDVAQPRPRPSEPHMVPGGGF